MGGLQDFGHHETSYYDVPHGEPELIQELLHPWSERSIPGQMFDRARRMWTQQNAPGVCVFESEMASARSEPGAETIHWKAVND